MPLVFQDYQYHGITIVPHKAESVHEDASCNNELLTDFNIDNSERF